MSARTLDSAWTREDGYAHAAAIAALLGDDVTRQIRRTLVLSPTGTTHRATVAVVEGRSVFRLRIRTACGGVGDPATWMLLDTPETRRLALFVAPRICRRCQETA